MAEKNKKNEISFHNKRFKDGRDSRKGFEKFYTITINSQNYFKTEFSRIINSKNKLYGSSLVLDYGCGIDAHGLLGTINNSKKPENIFDFYKKHKMQFIGIDISPEAIKIANKNAKKINFNASYKIMDAENTKFKKNNFDLIFGKGILHHLNFENCLPELGRILKKDGSCLFFEPMHHNPIIRLGRFFTPQQRTKDEHPLLDRDINLFKKYFKTVKYKTFCLTNLFSFLFYKTPLFYFFLNFFNKIDECLFKKFPQLKKYGWIIILELKDPY